MATTYLAANGQVAEVRRDVAPKRLEPRPPPDALPPEEPPPTERNPAPARDGRRHPVKVLPPVSREVLAFGRSVYASTNDQTLPKSRDDCRDGPRPCPIASCSAHLKFDVNPRTGSISDNFPGVEIEDMADTCSLDVADRGPRTHEEIGRALGVTKQRAEQIEVKATAKLIAQSDRLRDLLDDDMPRTRLEWAPRGER